MASVRGSWSCVVKPLHSPIHIWTIEETKILITFGNNNLQLAAYHSSSFQSSRRLLASLHADVDTNRAELNLSCFASATPEYGAVQFGAGDSLSSAISEYL